MNRKDILKQPVQNGLAPINYGVVTNQGYDLEIGYQDQKGDFGYSIKGIYGYAHNEIVEKSESVKPYAYMSQTEILSDSLSAIFPTVSLALMKM